MEPSLKRQKMDSDDALPVSSIAQPRAWGANAKVASSVGLDEFLNTVSNGFDCVIKSRYENAGIADI